VYVDMCRGGRGIQCMSIEHLVSKVLTCLISLLTSGMLRTSSSDSCWAVSEITVIKVSDITEINVCKSIDGIHSIFSQLEGKGSCDVNIDQSADSMVM